MGLARANGGRRNCGGGENSDERREDTLRQHDAVGSRSRVMNVERQELVGGRRVKRNEYGYVKVARESMTAPPLASTPDSEDERQGLSKAD